MALGNTMKKVALRTAFDYIGKNPEDNMPKLMDWVDRFAGDGPDSFPAQRAASDETPSTTRTTTVYRLVTRHCATDTDERCVEGDL